MKTIKTSTGVEIKIYSTGKELEISRYTEFQKYIALESGLGSDLDSLKSRFQRIEAFIQEDKKQDALTEVKNALRTCSNAINYVSYYQLAFACLVAEIGGQPQTDCTESGLKTVLEKLGATGLTEQDLEDAVDDVKKKS